MLRRLPALLLAALLLVPAAGAFFATQDDVSIRFDQAGAPLMVAAGRAQLAGVASGALLGAFVDEARVGPIPLLSILDARSGASALPQLTDVPRAVIVVHDGHLAWRLENGTAGLEATADYGITMALPSSPFSAEGEPAPGVILAAPALDASVDWSRGEAFLVPIRANVTILDEAGKPVPGYDRVFLNPQGNPNEDAPGGLALQAIGAFKATMPTRGLAVGLDNKSATMRVDVTPAAKDRFVDTLNSLQEATTVFAGGGQEGPGIPADALSQVAPLGGFFNGAVLVLDAPGEDDAEPAIPIEAKLGDQALETGPFTLVRSPSIALEWGGGSVDLGGRTTVAVTKVGFATAPPLVVGVVPLLAVLLWLAAIGAVVYYFVKRPPKADPKVKMKLIGLAIYAGVAILVFLWWDYSFAQTFGTSILRYLAANGVSGQTILQLGTIFGIEMLPWTLAALLFALPVRIALGILLRYRGEGSSYKNVAKAGGLLSLAIFGPLYALWIVNLVFATMLKMAPGMLGN
jgi:hypothetical protein